MFDTVKRHGGLGHKLLKAWRLYRQSGVRGVYHRIRALLGIPTAPVPRTYVEWVRQYDSWPPHRLAALQTKLGNMPVQPRFLVCIPGGNGALRRNTIESLKKQPYTDWILQEGAKPSDADWVLVLYPGTLLAPHALISLVIELQRDPEAHLLYGDEDFLGPDGERYSPDFKPDWNPFLFYSTAWLSSVYAVRRQYWAGQAANGTPELTFLRTLLGVLERVDGNRIRHVARVLAHRPGAERDSERCSAPPPTDEAAALLQAHLMHKGVAATVSVEAAGYRLQYALPEPAPMASIIIPTRNGVALMRQCVESIFAHTEYPAYEIIVVDNGSDDEHALAYFAQLAEQCKIRLLRDDSPFNYSALNNMAVAHAQGDVIVLLNNDIEVIGADWLREMVSIAMQPEVGAVGARLLYPDDTVQHAGIILGIQGVAGHGHKHLKRTEYGYQHRAALAQNLSAVTAACLAVRKSVWQEVGGLNEPDLKVAFNDVDFCIRLLQAGYRNVWTPYAELYHHESASRGTEDNPEKRARFAHEVRYMQKCWANELMDDKAYNPALTLEHEDFSLAWPPRYTS